MKIEETQTFHVPVLLNEVLVHLGVVPYEWYIDATAGGGGHTQQILKAGGRVVAIDQDKEAIKYLIKHFNNEIQTQKLKVIEDNFQYLKKIIKESGIKEFRGILFDLGLSSYQIRHSGRGFSFKKDEPLDMRMSVRNELTGTHIINTFSRESLYEIFTYFGEEQLAGAVAHAICRARALAPVTTTRQLAEIVAEVYRQKRVRTKIDPATKVFQALRIVVNRELDVLEDAIEQGFEMLAKNGKCLVISFHSLEDRKVKKVFLKIAHKGTGKVVTKKPIVPSWEEVRKNISARSAKLRVLQKL